MPNALRIADPRGDPDNPLTAGSPTWADAYTQTTDALGTWLAAQRAKSANMGLWNDQTGLPTGAGVVNAGQQYGNALLMGTTAPGGKAPSPFDYRPDPGRRVPADNYLKSLDTHASLMFREAHPSEAAQILPGNITVGGHMEKFLADNPDIALGQAQNKGGIQLAFDASKLQGQINRSKPAWDLSFTNGSAEYVGKGQNTDFRSALAGVRVPDTLNLSKGDGRAVSFGLKRLESQGWTRRTTDNGYTEYLPPVGQQQ